MFILCLIRTSFHQPQQLWFEAGSTILKSLTMIIVMVPSVGKLFHILLKLERSIGVNQFQFIIPFLKRVWSVAA